MYSLVQCTAEEILPVLIKNHSKFDLLLYDPPYNTKSSKFRYNDNKTRSEWLAWLKTIFEQSYQVMADTSAIIVNIDHRELFYLGALLDEIFGEENRIGIITWQKSVAKSQSLTISTTTEYILCYKKGDLQRYGGVKQKVERLNKYKNTDNDPKGRWTVADPTAPGNDINKQFGLLSQTGQIYYPKARNWAYSKEQIIEWMSVYGDCSIKSKDNREYIHVNYTKTPKFLPHMFFLKDGKGRPMVKKYLDGDEMCPHTFWSAAEFGHTKGATIELQNIMGKDIEFGTPKPLKLIETLLHIFSPKNGRVLDVFAGSGTTGHAVINLNKNGDNRTFLLSEPGSKDDQYCSTLTKERLEKFGKIDFSSCIKDFSG